MVLKIKLNLIALTRLFGFAGTTFAKWKTHFRHICISSMAEYSSFYYHDWYTNVGPGLLTNKVNADYHQGQISLSLGSLGVFCQFETHYIWFWKCNELLSAFLLYIFLFIVHCFLNVKWEIIINVLIRICWLQFPS